MAEKGRGGATVAGKGRSAARRLLGLRERLLRARRPAEVLGERAEPDRSWVVISVFIRAFLCEISASAWF